MSSTRCLLTIGCFNEKHCDFSDLKIKCFSRGFMCRVVARDYTAKCDYFVLVFRKNSSGRVTRPQASQMEWLLEFDN